MVAMLTRHHDRPYLEWSAAEDAPVEAGNFNATATQQEDVAIPLVRGGSANGLVIEVLAYLELKAGYHRLGLNTIGGYQASMGPDGRDRLSRLRSAEAEQIQSGLDSGRSVGKHHGVDLLNFLLQRPRFLVVSGHAFHEQFVQRCGPDV